MTSKDLYRIKQHCEEHDVSITFTNDLIYIRKTFSFNGELMVFKRAYTYKDVHLNFLLRGTLVLFESDFEKAYEKFMEETNKMRALGEVYGEDVADHINETWSRPSIMVTKEEVNHGQIDEH